MTILPERYQPALGLYETQKAIGLIKNIFQVKLCAALHLKRVTAPLFVDPATGLNDDLNGVERPVGFDIPAVGIEGQVVHSLAKWKHQEVRQTYPLSPVLPLLRVLGIPVFEPARRKAPAACPACGRTSR